MARTRIQRMPGVMPRRETIVDKPKRSKAPFFIVLLALILGGIYWFIFMGPTFAIEKVEVTGITNDSITTIANRLVGTNIFGVSTDGLEQEIQQVYPPVARITLVRGLPHTLRIAIELRTPVLRWQAGEDVFILDSNGQVFAKGDQEAYKDLPRIVDFSGLPVLVGQDLIAPSFIEFVRENQQAIPDLLHRNVVSYEVHETPFHLDIMVEGDLRLKLTTQRPDREQLQGARDILLAHPTAHLIDVRVPGRGYYI